MKIFLNTFLILLLSITCLESVNAQVIQEWFKRYNGPGDDIATSIAIDKSGNCYVTGYSNDIVTIKYNSNGDSLWVRRYNGPGLGDDRAFSVKIDLSGNIYVCGYSLGSGTGIDYVTIKYNSSGAEQWVRRYNGPANANDYATAMELDSAGNIYVTGYSAGSGTSDDYATLKYNPLGTLQWLKRYNGTANGIDHARAIDVDSLGNVYVTGRSAGISTGNSDYATIKYGSSGDSLWVKRYNGPGNGADSANAILVGINGNIFVCGNSFGISTGSSDYATIMYNSAGDSLWVRRYNGPPGNNTDQANAIVTDKKGNVFVTGYSVGSGTGNDFATLKYNSSGVQQWVNRFNSTGGGDDQAKAIAIDHWGDIYVTGHSNTDIRTIKYHSNGDSLWKSIYNNGDFESAYGIAIDSLRNVYVTGQSRQFSFGPYDYVTVKYSQSQCLYLTATIEGFYDNFSNKMVRDTIRAYLRNSNSPYSILDSVKIYLDSNGKGVFNFFSASNEVPYYLSLKHRNSIETWSKPVIFSSYTLNYDFTTSANKAYGDNLVLKGSKYCIYSGDVNQDGAVESIDLGFVDNDAAIGVGGYVKTDLNGDFFIDAVDLTISDNNIFRFVSKMTPP